MRPFTDQERQVIGRDLFAKHRWKKMGIDELCRAAGLLRGLVLLPLSRGLSAIPFTTR